MREGVSGEAREAAGPDWEVLMSLPEPGFSPEPWEGSRQGRVDLYFLWGMVGRPLQTLGGAPGSWGGADVQQSQ